MNTPPKTLIERGFDISRLTRNDAGDVSAMSLSRQAAQVLGVERMTTDIAVAQGLTPDIKTAFLNLVKMATINVSYARAIAAWIGCGEWDLYPSRYNPPAPRQLTKMERFRIERRAFRHQFIKGPRAQAARSMAFALLAK